MIDESGAPARADAAWVRSLHPAGELAVQRAPQPSVAEPLPVLAAQSARGSRTLGLRVPQAPRAPKRPVRATVGYVSPQQQLADAFLEIDRQFEVLASGTRGRLATLHAAVSEASARLQGLIGPARRFTSARGDEARMVTAHVQDGTAELVGLAEQVREEIRRRAHAAAPAFDPLLADLDPSAPRQDAEVAS